MSEQDAKNLKVGDKVIWDNNPDDGGSVTEVGYTGVFIQWDNGQKGMIDFRDFAHITRR